MWHKIKNNQFLKQSAVFTIASGLVNILGYLFHAIVGRFLGPAKYGDVVTVIAYSLILSVPMMAASVELIKRVGIEKTLLLKQKFVSGVEGALYQLLQNYWWGWLILYLMLGLVGYLNQLSPAAYLLMPGFVILFVISQIYQPLLQSVKMFWQLSGLIIFTALIKLLSASSVLFTSSLVPIFLFLIISAGVQLWLGHRYLRQTFPPLVKRVFKLRLKKIIANQKLQLTFFSILGITLLNNLDILLAKRLLSAHDAGLFGVWSLFGKLIAYSSMPLSAVALVFFADRGESAQSKKILAISVGLIAILGVALLGGYYWWGEWLLTFLVGGQFARLAQVLPLAAIFGTFYSLIYVVNNYFLAQDSKIALIVPVGIPLVYGLIALHAVSLSQLVRWDIGGSGILLLLLVGSYLKASNA